MFKRARTSTLMSRRRNESVSVKSNGEFYAFCKKLDKLLVGADMDVTITLEDIGIAEISILPMTSSEDPLNFDLSIQDGGASLQLINCDNGEDTWFDGIRDDGTEKKVANEILAFVREVFVESRRPKHNRNRRRNESIRCDMDDSFYKLCRAVDREIQYGLLLDSRTTVNHIGLAEICIYGDVYNRGDVCLKLDIDHDMNLTVFNDDVSWEHAFYDVQVKDIVGIIKKTVEDAWGFKLKV